MTHWETESVSLITVRNVQSLKDFNTCQQYLDFPHSLGFWSEVLHLSGPCENLTLLAILSRKVIVLTYLDISALYMETKVV